MNVLLDATNYLIRVFAVDRNRTAVLAHSERLGQADFENGAIDSAAVPFFVKPLGTKKG
jgi:hypothetical protein